MPEIVPAMDSPCLSINSKNLNCHKPVYFIITNYSKFRHKKQTLLLKIFKKIENLQTKELVSFM
jgi:hypothetical protein